MSSVQEEGGGGLGGGRERRRVHINSGAELVRKEQGQERSCDFADTMAMK